MAAKKILLADLIEEAATTRLSPKHGHATKQKSYMSCCAFYRAARAALYRADPDRGTAASDAFDHLVDSMGLNDSAWFTEFEPGIERQSVRFAWLMLVAQVAREEGIEV